MVSRLKEMLLMSKGSDLKSTDIFSDVEANKWKSKALLFLMNVHKKLKFNTYISQKKALPIYYIELFQFNFLLFYT